MDATEGPEVDVTIPIGAAYHPWGEAKRRRRFETSVGTNFSIQGGMDVIYLPPIEINVIRYALYSSLPQDFPMVPICQAW